MAKSGGTGAKGGGHEGVADVVPGVVVVVGVERSLGRGAMEPLMRSDAGESAEGAQERIGGCALRDLFAADTVLLCIWSVKVRLACVRLAGSTSFKSGSVAV